MAGDEDSEITHWFSQLKAGKEEAANKLWNAYFDSLVRLARKRIGDGPRRISDEHDVAASVFHCLCDGAKQGRFAGHTDRTDLWKLLVMITRQKLADRVRRATAAKRGGGEVLGESAFIAAGQKGMPRGIEQVVSAAPTPADLAEVNDQFERLLNLLGDDTLKRIATARLEGLSNEEIAERTHRSLRSVERKLQQIRDRWAREVYPSRIRPPSSPGLFRMSYFVTPADCSKHTIFPGVDIQTMAGENMMLSLVEFEPGAIVQPHAHPHEQIGMLLEGELTFTIGSEKRTVRPGEMWRIPGGVVHSAVAGDKRVKALDVFNPIREDYR